MQIAMLPFAALSQLNLWVWVRERTRHDIFTTFWQARSSNYTKAQTFNGLIYFPSVHSFRLCFFLLCCQFLNKSSLLMAIVQNHQPQPRALLGKMVHFGLATTGTSKYVHEPKTSISIGCCCWCFACFIYCHGFDFLVFHCKLLEFSQASIRRMLCDLRTEREAKRERAAHVITAQSIVWLRIWYTQANLQCRMNPCLVRRLSLSFARWRTCHLPLAECMTQRMYDLLRAIPLESVQRFLQSF